MNSTTQKVLIGVVALAFIAAMGFAIFKSRNEANIPAVAVTNFEDCLQAGYPVTESRPRECRTPDGERFVEAPTGSNPTALAKDGCYIGGCSAEICSDNPDAVSTCEYHAEYSCYTDATCERQASGKCGWTQTSVLKLCLSADYNTDLGK